MNVCSMHNFSSTYQVITIIINESNIMNIIIQDLLIIINIQNNIINIMKIMSLIWSLSLSLLSSHRHRHQYYYQYLQHYEDHDVCIINIINNNIMNGFEIKLQLQIVHKSNYVNSIIKICTNYPFLYWSSQYYIPLSLFTFFLDRLKVYL